MHQVLPAAPAGSQRVPLLPREGLRSLQITLVHITEKVSILLNNQAEEWSWHVIHSFDYTRVVGHSRID